MSTRLTGQTLGHKERLDLVLTWNKSTVESAHSAHPALVKLRQGHHEFEVILGYMGDFIMYFSSTTLGRIYSGV